MAAEEFDEEVIQTVTARSDVLAALAESPHHRRDLQERFDISKTTCHRIVHSLDDMNLLRRTEEGYELSELGQRVSSQVTAFERNVRTAYRLQPLLETFEPAAVTFDVELFADATVTYPQPDDPSPPVNRYLELFRDAETIRTLDRTSFIPPLYVEEILERAIEKDGSGVAIYPRSVVERRYADHAAIHRNLAEADVPVRYRVHDDVPFGMTIYDENRVGLRAYDNDTGTLRLFADTANPAAVEWAMDVFDRFYEESDPAWAFDVLPDWVPDTEIQL